MTNYKFFAIVGVSMAILTGMFYYAYSRISSPSKVITSEAGNRFRLYQNSLFSFSLQYPSDLIVQETVPPKGSPQEQVIFFSNTGKDFISDTAEKPLTIEIYTQDPSKDLSSSGTSIDYIKDSTGAPRLLVSYKSDIGTVSNALVVPYKSVYLVFWFGPSLEKVKDEIIKSINLE